MTNLIVPGVSIGPVSIGITPAAAMAALGRVGEGAVLRSGSAVIAWPKAGLHAIVHRGRIVNVEADSLLGVNFRTKDGIRTGSPFGKVVIIYGAAHCTPVPPGGYPKYRWVGCKIPGPAGRATVFISDIQGGVGSISVGLTQYTPRRG